EYAFYVFFFLSVLCIASVLAAESLRVGKQLHAAVAVERWTRAAFLALVIGTIIWAVAVF
ncbi:MAG: hypothetical protein JO255_17360, partial [Alphaproteobacteria bacterium]|nr:hypothetical protein [Alphaproteobacteria bacterium]